MLLSPDPTTYEHSKTKNIELKLLWNREGGPAWVLLMRKVVSGHRTDES